MSDERVVTHDIVKLSEQLRRNGEREKALALLEAGFTSLPHSPNILLSLGSAAYESGNEIKALNCWKRALDVAPDSDEAKFLHHIALRRMGLHEAEDLNTRINPADLYFDWPGSNSSEVVESLRRTGIAVVKNILPPELIEEIGARFAKNLNAIDDILRDAPPAAQATMAPFMICDDLAKIREWLQKTLPKNGGYIPNNDWITEFGFETIEQILESSGLSTIAREFTSDRAMIDWVLSCARRVQPQTSDTLTIAGPHQDVCFNDSASEIRLVTCWVLLAPSTCAESSCVSFVNQTIRHSLPYDPQKPHAIDESLLPPDVFWIPDVEIGDAVLFAPHTVHATAFWSTDNKTRFSLDIRFRDAG